MDALDLVDKLITLPDVTTKLHFLDESSLFLSDEVANLLKQKADHFLRADIHHSLEIAELLSHIANLTLNPLHEALGMLVEANARSIGLGEYDQAIGLYDQAAEIYHSQGRLAEQARSQVGKVNALSYLGRFDEALEIGQWASPILEAHNQWLPLITLIMNLGIVYGRQGKDIEALAMFDRAGELYRQIEHGRKTGWALIQQNRAVILRILGRFDASIEASQSARDVLNQLGETIEAARAQQGLALTYFVLGRFNEALELLDNVREIFLADGRERDAMLVELYISDCLLQLRRFPEVLEKCQQVRGLFAELGTYQIEALAIINEAIAYAELHRYEEALSALSKAQRKFLEVGNEARAACTDLEMAAVFFCLDRYTKSLKTAQRCVLVFKTFGLPIEEAQALTIAARAALALNEYSKARNLVTKALRIGVELNVPTVRYQGHSILGELAIVQGDTAIAQKEFDLAIQEVEQLRGRLMVEFRVSYLEDKESLYQNMVEICIDQNQPLRGLEYAERAKSRALLDLLAYRLDLTIRARNKEDLPLVDELTRLRAERDRLHRRWESDADIDTASERGWSASQSARQKAQQDVLVLEKQITALWHRLLVHNADYSHEAALWTVCIESAQPFLDKDTLLLEYFIVHGKLIVFSLTANEVQVVRLEADLDNIQALMQRLRLNLRAVPKSQPDRIVDSVPNAKNLLFRLYQLLIAPLEIQLSIYPKLIIVPHSSLHYLPFHALYNGTTYLLERHEISYLPNSSSLRYCHEVQPATQSYLAVGYSNEGRLPFTVDEANRIATILDGEALNEDKATLKEFNRIAHECRVIHLAAHGDFRLDNPLFSGVALADGWLTTMDIFNLRLNASLVTLSACRTGRNVLGGGDELLGLMRAFLSAGTASIALTLWAVEDRSTKHIMEVFYSKLTEGYGKGAALRWAQLQLLSKESQSEDEQTARYAHPYFWAPFFLVGDTGPL